jgi:L-fuconolactonase
MPIIDAHQHFWQLSKPKPYDYEWIGKPGKEAINRDYLPADLKKRMDEVGVTHTVFVQTQHHLDENLWVLKFAEENPWILGVVGWVDLQSPDCEKQLVAMREHKKFVGVRHIVHDEPDDDWIVRPAVINGLKVLEKHGVPYDLLFFVKHLKHAATLAKQLPNLPLVIDHLAKPKIKNPDRADAVAEWLPQLAAAAKYPNVYCKLSGMVTEADWKNWKADDLRPFVDHALELFGAERCMFGSDWPVCELAGSYKQVYHALIEALGPLSASEREMIFSGTAKKFYGLKVT